MEEWKHEKYAKNVMKILLSALTEYIGMEFFNVF